MTALAAASTVASPFQAMRIGRKPDAMFEIRPGTISDYHALSRFHYRAARPATIARILVIDVSLSDTVGVLTVSMPTLNGRWRDLAWPDRFRSRDRAADTARINRELRTISRVIIDPRYRGLGLAAALVRAYLARPLTPATEAVAAMGAISPFFERAGMMPYTLAPHAREQRLAHALQATEIAAIHLLRMSSPSEWCHWSQPPWAVASVLRALQTWANASRTTRHLLAAPPHQLARAAAMALLARPIAYAHGRADLTPVPQAPLAHTRGPHVRTGQPVRPAAARRKAARR
jgi:GNAT superfamily N-acetyltransferase